MKSYACFFILLILVIMTGCADSNKKAQSLLEEAERLYSQAIDEKDYQIKLELLNDVLNNIKEISTGYPDSVLAVQLAQGKEIGSVPQEKILEQKKETEIVVRRLKSKKAWEGHKDYLDNKIKSLSKWFKEGKHEDCIEALGLEFVDIPAGSFMMGNKYRPKEVAALFKAKPEWFRDEYPRHKVTISKSFQMMSTEVTQEVWYLVMGYNYSENKIRLDMPAENLSWNEAQKFIKTLNMLAGGEIYRLPTEAQWEYACRAGTQTLYNTGDNITTNQANYDGRNPIQGHPKGDYQNTLTPVKSFKANAWGLYDMHGNVQEWCQDNYELFYEDRTEVVDPKGARFGTLKRVSRGGWYKSGARNLRSASRNGRKPDAHLNYGCGLRLVRDMP